MRLKFLTVSKYELRQYSRNYLEQFFILAGILSIFWILSNTSQGTVETPSSYKLYRIGYVAGTMSGNYSHYTISMLPYDSKEEAASDLSGGVIDVFVEEHDSVATFQTSGSSKSKAALKRIKQVIITYNRDLIYQMADVNETLDGILLPIKVRTVESEIDYTTSIKPEVYLHRIRFINREGDVIAPEELNINMLDPESIGNINLTEYILKQDKYIEEASNETSVGFTLPEEWEVPFVFKRLYDNMAIVAVSILFSMLLTLSFAREKVNRTLENIFQTPLGRWEILLGKTLPYFGAMALVNLAYSIMSTGTGAIKVFYILTVLSATLASFALFTVVISKNYREVTFTSSISLMTFLIFIVLPNVFSGMNVLAFLSPLDTITTVQNNAYVSYSDVFLSLLPYKFLTLFFAAFTLSCFQPEVFQSTPGLKDLSRAFYLSLSRRLGGGVKYAIASVSLLVPFVYIVQTLMAYVILPIGYMAPYASIMLLAFIEELVKILPYTYNRRIKPAVYGLTAGLSFFATEKLFNIYLISKVYSYLPTPYTVFVVKGLIYTMVVHIILTTFLSWLISKNKSRTTFLIGLAAVTLAHYTYNITMMRGGLR
ncbi:MAG: hypothetical protein V1744_02195 [Candidatus Altiarchaeota archaeon]